MRNPIHFIRPAYVCVWLYSITIYTHRMRTAGFIYRPQSRPVLIHFTRSRITRSFTSPQRSKLLVTVSLARGVIPYM